MAIETNGEDLKRYQFTEHTGNNHWQRFESSDAVYISEPFAYQHNIKAGDPLILSTGVGNKTFKVEAIFTDYIAGKGLVVLPLPAYQRYWNDNTINSLCLLYTSPSPRDRG